MSGLVPSHIRRRDVLKRSLVFRSSVDGRYVSRWFAFKNPRETYGVPRKGSSR